MARKPLKLLALIGILASAGCESSDAAYDRGYSDGYAEGYNTECKIRATLVAGDWDDEAYSRGYDQGRRAGVQACRRDR